MFKKILYAVWILVLAIFFFWSLYNESLQTFVQSMENSTFDIRQKLISNSGTRKPNKDIVIVAIDDASYEYILNQYGEWPLPRDIYAKVINYIEAQSPKSIALDLMFVKSIKSSKNADEKLIQTFKKYKNLYTAMNMDNQSQDLRTAPILPKKLMADVTDIYDKTYDYLEYTNCRKILDGIIDATSNIGMINVSRSDDGVLREMPLFIRYKENFYPQLGLLVGTDYLNIKNKRNYVVQWDGTVLYDSGKRRFYPDSDGGIIINWYGPAGTFDNIPLFKILRAAQGKEKLDYDFKDKIVYFGATAASLFDIKTVPVDKVYPGVEVQTTYVNNIIDGSSIKKCPEFLNIIFGILLAVLTVWFVLNIESMLVASGCVLTAYAIYIIFTYEMMSGRFGAYLWLQIVAPVMLALFAYIVAVVVKYIIKSRDFDYQYKLATTDGLTELYNHRYFQEQMQMACANAERYDMPFSLIIFDIDFFKKFNDSFGHQSGDAVLRQVALTLKKNVRASDIVCRYGGEEMSVILPNTSENEAVNIAEKLRQVVAAKTFHLTGNRESNVSVSAGVATYGEKDGINPQDLISSADKRLYNAKENGRNRVN